MLLDENIRKFIIHITFLSLKIKITIYLAKKTQIVYLSIREILKTIMTKYSNFINSFLKS